MTPEEQEEELKRYFNVSIGDALQRASWAASASYKNKRPNGQPLGEGGRVAHAQMSLMWSNYALAMQQERQWERDEIERIKKSATGQVGEHAEVPTDESDRVHDGIVVEHEEVQGQGFSS